MGALDRHGRDLHELQHKNRKLHPRRKLQTDLKQGLSSEEDAGLTLATTTGVMIWRRCEETIELLKQLADQDACERSAKMQQSGQVNFFDQSLMTETLLRPEWAGIVTEIPAKSFNSYLPNRAEMNNAWEADDFILHLAGMADSERLKWAKRLRDPMM